GKAESRRGLGRRRNICEEPRGRIECKGGQGTVRTGHIEPVLPESGRGKNFAAQGKHLNCSGVRRRKAPEKIAVQEVDLSRISAPGFSAADQQVRNRRRRRKIHKNDRSARAKVEI